MTGMSGELIPPQGQNTADSLRGWVIMLLTLLFVALYGAALAGWLKSPSDERMLARLEPIIFVIIGYYFGRLPAQQNERTLREEIGRQTHRSDAAQHTLEQALQSREALEEKVKNARAALAASVAQSRAPAGYADKPVAGYSDEALRASVKTTLNILNS